MDEDEFDTPPPPIDVGNVKTEEDESVSIVPLKRKSSVDLSEEQSQALPSQADAQRAYLVKSAPHLFNGNGSNGSQSPVSPDSPVSSTLNNAAASSISHSPSSSARPSPNPSEEESGERGGSLGLSTRGEVKSRHAVPKGFRGPVPRAGDAEDAAPKPTLIPVPGRSNLFNTLNYPYNRNGYHYLAAGPASEHLPTSVYRTLDTEPRGVHWSWIDRSSFTNISQDATIVSSDRGFRCARTNVPVREGSWYVELHILPPEVSSYQSNSMKEGPHIRLGWGRREAGLNAPVGINGYSYGVRDTTGEKVFLSRTYQYGNSFGPGDVVGMYISLPTARKVNAKDPMDPARISRKRIPIRYKGRLFFETLDYPVSKEMEHLMERSRRGEKLKEGKTDEESINVATGMLMQPIVEETVNAAAKKKRKSVPGPGPSSTPNTQSNFRPLPTLGPDSQIGFFINGEPQGIAFENLLDFRPLRKQGPNQGGKSKTASKANTSSLGLSEEGVKDSIITTNSSLASILKSRENFFDDGSLGYFPFVSLFGGAKVQIVSRAADFRFPPPINVREALEEADRLRGRERTERSGATEMELVTCRPLEERYNEYLEELWKQDLVDEVKAKETAHLLQSKDDYDDEDEEVVVVEKKAGAKKSKKRATPSSRNESPRARSTPLRDEQHVVETISKSGMFNEIKQDETEEEEASPMISEELLKPDQEHLLKKEEAKEPISAMEVEWEQAKMAEQDEPMQVDE